MKLCLSALGAVAVAAAAVVGVSPSSPVAAAAAPVPVTVTISAQGTELSGVVRSSRTVCKAERTVVVYRQVGARGGGNDIRFATDTTGLRNGAWVWSTGNTGQTGYFYARTKATSQCKAAASATVRAVRRN